jgi:hypothetical protein
MVVLKVSAGGGVCVGEKAMQRGEQKLQPAWALAGIGTAIGSGAREVAAVLGQGLLQFVQPAKGLARLLAPGGLMIRLSNGGPGDQRADKDEHARSAVAQVWNTLGEIESFGAPAAGFAATIGTQDTFADGLWIVPMLFLVDEAVGYQLMALGAVVALKLRVAVKLQGKLVEGVEVVKK